MGQNENRALDRETDYVRMFNAFFSRGGMTATYKAVFLRCLLDLGEYDARTPNSGLPGSEWIEVDGDTLTLDLNFVAARFVKYYWDMDHSFRLKQTSNPGDAKIVQLVREGHRAGNLTRPPTLVELASPSHRKIRQDTILMVIKKQALTYLPTNMPALYTRVPRSNKIRLRADLIPFLRQHRVIIRNGINYKLAAHLEKLNKTIPQIAAKLDEDNYPPRYLGSLAEEFIDCEQGGLCFYCDASYWKGKRRQIDHVIPYNYIFSTDAHNCVAACVGCNLKKHDRLPSTDLFSRVLVRNDALCRRLSRLPQYVKGSFETYDKVWYERTYNACRAEYHGDAPYFIP